MEKLKKYLPDLLAVLLFVAIAFAYFMPADLEGRILYQHDASAGRGAGQEALEYLQRTGERTRWTNSTFSGMPTYQTSPSYKSTDLLTKVMDAYHLWLPENVWYVFVYLLGFYILMRVILEERGERREERGFSSKNKIILSVLGSIVWAFSSYFFIIIAAGHIWKVWALAYLPPMIAGIVLAYRGRYLWGFILTALFAAFEVKANHVQMTYYYLFLIALMVVAYLVEAVRTKQMARFLKATAVCVAAGAIGILMNISNLYHTWEYSKETMRGKSELVKPDNGNQTSGGLERDYITQWSYGIGETWTLLVPNTKGGASVPMARNEKAMQKADPQLLPLYQQIGQYWGEQPMTSGPVYVGAFVLMLFVLGLFVVKGPMKWALLAATVLSIMLSWGKNFMGLTDFFIDYVPMYAKFRTVASILVVAEFTIPLLAMMALGNVLSVKCGVGSENSSENKGNLTSHSTLHASRFSKWLLISYALTAGACVLFALMPRLFFSDFVSTQEMQALSQFPPEQLTPILANLRAVRESIFTADCWRSFFIITIGTALLLWAMRSKATNTKTYAVCGIIVLCLIDMWTVNKRYLNDAMFVEKSVREMPQQKTATDEQILQDKSLDYRVLNLASNTFNENETSYYHKSIGGYHAAKLRRYQEMIEAYIVPEMQKLMPAIAEAQGDMTQVAGDSIYPVLNMLNTKYVIVPLQGGQTVPIMNPYAYGNAWFVDRLTYAQNANDELDRVGRIDLRHEAVADVKFKDQLGEAQPQDTASVVTLAAYEPNELQYDVRSGKGGIVVFSEVYYPGWTATVDGEPAELGRVNYILRAMNLKPGEHKVVLSFKPQSIKRTETMAYVASAVLLLAVLGGLFVQVRRSRAFLLLCCFFVASGTFAQSGRSSSSQYLTTLGNSDVYVPFRISDEGKQLPVRWGMDVAWMSRQNMLKGINHIGKQNLSLVRSSFRNDAPLTNETDLTTSQIKVLRDRMTLANLLGADCDLILNSDQEAGVDSWYGTSGHSNVDHWVAMISANIDYIQKYYPRHKVLGISPFNEPDYAPWAQGSKADMKEISRQLKEKYPDILITAGNTLNCDEALSWYNAVKPYVDWGNTHQLAGSFDSYANFFQRVVADGNYAYADELHNVGEAMVGVEYGMQAGVWWGFDSRARGEFCHISNHGSRIGYGENRSKWTSASVYRDDETQAVKAFLGSSERQANTSTFAFVSTDREVYFDGYGPLRAYRMEIPGGTGYQKGQTNAERVINVTYGDDVPPSPIVAGTYKIMNFATCGVAAVYGSSDGHPNISQMKWTGLKVQQWNIDLVDPRIGGDYSFYRITDVQTGKYMNVLNNSLSSANIISYDADCASNEQWYLEYAGDGCYFIRNRESGLYMELAQKSGANGTNIRQGQKATTEAQRQLQMWRILPVEVACETVCPAMPVGLTAEAGSASVRLTWEPNTEDDLAGYMVLRAEKGTGNWNTIARKIAVCEYVDNTCRQGVDYEYKVKAIDLSENQSECSATVETQTTGTKGLIARWPLDDDLNDATENLFDAIHGSTPTFVAQHVDGSKSLNFNGSTDFLLLPYEIADMDEMTISMWVYWTNSTTTMARLFDFGNGPTQYLYLTPHTGNGMRLVVKNGDDEQQLNYKVRLSTRQWRHVAVTIGGGRVALLIDGEEKAAADGFTIRPSDIRPSINYIGRGQTASDPKFRGYIDDVRIFNYALSADEVKAVMGDVVDGIQQVEYEPGDATSQHARETRYDLLGRPVTSSGQRGIVIRRQADGTSVKVRNEK